MKIFTIGFTRKSAETFFGLLRLHEINQVIDIRLRPDGQLAGFAKRADLAFFLQRLANCDYRHEPSLAPSDEILSDYRKDHDWATYTRRFETLMADRQIPESVDRALFDHLRCCLLCSEPTPEQCHRRLVAERLQRAWPGVEIVHIV